MPPHQFIETEIFEMGVIGEVDIVAKRFTGFWCSPLCVGLNISRKKKQPGHERGCAVFIRGRMRQPQTEFVQRFEDAEIKSGAANSAPGKGKANSIDRRVIDPGLARRPGRLNRWIFSFYFLSASKGACFLHQTIV
jgi:hypothetical protein